MFACPQACGRAGRAARRGKRNARPLLLKERHGAARGRYRNLRFLLSAAEERNQQPKRRPRGAVRKERKAEGAAATIENRGGRNPIVLTGRRSRCKLQRAMSACPQACGRAGRAAGRGKCGAKPLCQKGSMERQEGGTGISGSCRAPRRSATSSRNGDPEARFEMRGKPKAQPRR